MAATYLPALRHLDGCAAIGAYVAIEKARSAVRGGTETQAFEEMINAGRTAFLLVPELEAMMTGGVPVVIDGKVAGAVGVSGVRPETRTAQTVKAGLAAMTDRIAANR